MSMYQFIDLLGLSNLDFKEFIWVAVGTLGQMIFFTRWLVQWFYSEKRGSSVIPVTFWWCSFVGGVVTLIYALHIRSFPFVLAQGIGIIVYSRNLILTYKNKNSN